MNVTWNFLAYLGMYLKKKTSLKKTCKIVDPSFLLPSTESCFSFRPLKSERRGPYRSQSEAGRPPCRSSQPLGLYEGGIREAACVAAIVYKGTRGWAAPMSAQRYNRKQGSGKILETRTHTCHSLDLGGSTLYYLGDTRRKRAEVGELVSNNSWFLNVRKRRRHMKKFTGLRHETLHSTLPFPAMFTVAQQCSGQFSISVGGMKCQTSRKVPQPREWHRAVKHQLLNSSD